MTNIAEILKNAPQGLKLYSLVHGEVTLEGVDTTQKYYPIDTTDKQNDISDAYSKDGKIYYDYDDAECVLFPSKGHKSWDNWQEVLFQCGDVVVSQNKTPVGLQTFLCYGNDDGGYLAYGISGERNYITPSYYRYATPEEREQFMAELNANGYTWNDNTKQMKKSLQYTPKYKVGDWLYDNDHGVIQITDIIGGNDGLYCFNNECQNLISLTDKFSRFATEQELIDAGVKEKQFTIDDLKPFDKVLVKHNSNAEWEIELFERYDNNLTNPYRCLSKCCQYCVPYNSETAHLLGTDDDYNGKYKTW